jgi:choline kinase
MKAVIFNSGLGNRMGEFTHTHHKSMSVLKNGETIFHRQLRLLSQEGIRRHSFSKYGVAYKTYLLDQLPEPPDVSILDHI